MTSDTVDAVPPPDEVADRRCLEQMARGEVAALRRLYERHGSRVLGFARRLLGDEFEAEEVTQDVFVRAWQKAAAYDSRRASPWGWLAMMTRSACIDRLRRRRRRPASICADSEGQREPDAGIGGAAAASDALVDLPGLFQGLRPAERACIVHMFLEGLTQAETASRTGLPLGSVKTHVRRGLQRMHAMLSNHDS